MSPRLSTKTIYTFIAFNACARQTLGIQPRTYSLYQSQCLKLPSTSTKRIPHKRHFHATTPQYASNKNPYNVLGLKKDATAAEIKKTYFALARKYHPDTNPDKNAREKFMEIQDAYDVLKDEKKRAAYDQYGAASQQPGFDPNAFSGAGGFGAGGFPGGFGSGFGGAGTFHGFPFSSGRDRGGASGDLFEQLFGFSAGEGARSRQNYRGEDIEASITVSFLEACKGIKKNVTISPIVDCSSCSATGLKSGVKHTTCTACGGSGTRKFVLDNGFQMASTCNVCNGAGSSIPRGGECQTCDGVGKVRVKQQVTVEVPVGADEGLTIRIPSSGDAPLAAKGSRGDLYVRVKVQPSNVFTRQGGNLHYKARIPFHRALLGGIVRVPTLDGEVDVRIPGGTQQGEEMVIKGRGVTRLNGLGVGDLFVKFNLQIPRSLTKRQRALLEAYADDVEGRGSSNPTSSETTDKTKAERSQSDSNEPLSVDNDTDSTKTSEPKQEKEKSDSKTGNESEGDKSDKSKRARG